MVKLKKPKKMIFLADTEIYEHLRALAFHRRTSMNALIREALIEYYKIGKKPKKK
jgi:hypothetical protein